MRRTFYFCCILALLATSSAFADVLNYSLTAGTDEITFSLPDQPTPGTCSGSLADCFAVSPVTLTVDGSTVANGEVDFLASTNEGGLVIWEGSTALVNDIGPQLFSGTLADPTLLAFTNLQLTLDGTPTPTFREDFVLNATLPEPTSVILMLTMLLGAAFVSRKRVAQGL
jgi:hypothetical protein